MYGMLTFFGGDIKHKGWRKNSVFEELSGTDNMCSEKWTDNFLRWDPFSVFSFNEDPDPKCYMYISHVIRYKSRIRLSSHQVHIAIQSDLSLSLNSIILHSPQNL